MAFRIRLLVLKGQVDQWPPRNRPRPNRRPRAIRLAAECLEERALLSLSAGSLDPTFGQGGVVTADFGREGDGRGELQPDGKFVAAAVDAVSGMPTVRVERFLPDGQRDMSFAAAQGGTA